MRLKITPNVIDRYRRLDRLAGAESHAHRELVGRRDALREEIGRSLGRLARAFDPSSRFTVDVDELGRVLAGDREQSHLSALGADVRRLRLRLAEVETELAVVAERSRPLLRLANGCRDALAGAGWTDL